jgi:Tfp pilus assembly protein PilZ
MTMALLSATTPFTESQNLHVEKRNGKRFGARFGVVFNDDHGLNFSFITNISRTGAYLHSRRLFTIGSNLEMKLSNGSYDAPIQGRVVRIERSMDDSGQFGMGITFDHLSPTAKRLRDDLLLYLMSLKYHKLWN